MSGIDGGCIFLARKIIESDIWRNKPAWWLKVWLYLLVRVNHTEKGKINRGQGFFRLEEIRENCQLFDVKTVSIDNVIKWLKSTTQITTQKTTRGMLITICNYDSYQYIKNYEATHKTIQETTTELQGNYTICKNERINKENTMSPDEGDDVKILPEIKNLPSKRKTTKEVVNHDVKIFIDFAFNTYKEKFEYPLSISAADGKIIKGLLGSFDISCLKDLWLKFINHHDEFIGKAGRSIGIFKVSINKLTSGGVYFNNANTDEKTKDGWDNFE